MQNILFWLKSHVKDIILISLVLVCIGLTSYSIYSNMSKEDVEVETAPLALNNPEEIAKTETEPKLFNVDIKGAIKNPGVYQVDSNSIINDIVNLAGGFKSNAYKNGINLSKKISDEMVIYVYTTSEIKAKQESAKAPDISNEVCTTPSYDICECVDNKTSIIETNNSESNANISATDKEQPSSNTITSGSDTKSLVNINTADVSALTSINGIGESKAEAIIEYRNTNGMFKSIEDIVNVTGIGESLLAKIKDYITV